MTKQTRRYTPSGRSANYSRVARSQKKAPTSPGGQFAALTLAMAASSRAGRGLRSAGCPCGGCALGGRHGRRGRRQRSAAGAAGVRAAALRNQYWPIRCALRCAHIARRAAAFGAGVVNFFFWVCAAVSVGLWGGIAFWVSGWLLVVGSK